LLSHASTDSNTAGTALVKSKILQKCSCLLSARLVFEPMDWTPPLEEIFKFFENFPLKCRSFTLSCLRTRPFYFNFSKKFYSPSCVAAGEGGEGGGCMGAHMQLKQTLQRAK
jgi:hypothetical protein